MAAPKLTKRKSRKAAETPLPRPSQSGLRPRGTTVVESVLRAALAEVARAGYGGLSVEAVASRAGVNKTTVYRRFATKAELMRAALTSTMVRAIVVPDTGTLKDDLIALARGVARFAESLEGRSLFSAMTASHEEPELARIAESVRSELEARPLAVIRRAIERGELPSDVDARLLFDALFGAVLKRRMAAPVPDDTLERIVEMLLHGALARDGDDATASRRPRRSSRPSSGLRRGTRSASGPSKPSSRTRRRP